jgi:hypothetical protein
MLHCAPKCFTDGYVSASFPDLSHIVWENVHPGGMRGVNEGLACCLRLYNVVQSVKRRDQRWMKFSWRLIRPLKAGEQSRQFLDTGSGNIFDDAVDLDVAWGDGRSVHAIHDASP